MARRDSNFDPQELLTQLPFVRGLARELLKGGAAADDVAQQAAAAALASGRAGAPLHGELRPWLVGVTRNLARMFRRGEQRREARERAAAVSETLPSSVDESVRFEALRRVVLAMERLDADERTLLVRRFYDEWPPRRIAAELRVPVNTVRTRLARSLERLRRELIDGGGRDGERELPALLLALVAPPPVTKVPWIAASPVATGALLMTAKMKLAVAAFVVVVAAAGVAWWPRAAMRTRTDGENVSRNAATAPVDGGVKETPAATRSEDAGTDARPTAPIATATRRVVALRGRLVAEAGDVGRWSSALTVTASIEQEKGGQLRAPPASDRLQTRVAVAPDGTFASELELDALSPRIGRLTLVGADPAFASFRRWFAVPDGTAPRLEWELEVHVFPAATVRGRVVDEKGRPVADGAVGVFTVAGSEAALIGETTVDSDGVFALGIPPPGACLVVASQRRTGPEPDWIDATEAITPQLLPAVAAETIDAARERDLGDFVLRSGVSIRGSVEWFAHGPVVGAIVDARPHRGPPQAITHALLTRSVALPSGTPPTISAVTDVHGEFEISGLFPGPFDVRARCLPDGMLLKEPRTGQQVVAPASDVVFRVDGAIVEYEVTSGGKPVEGAIVVTETPTSGWPAARNGRTETGADGRVGSVVAAAATCEYDASAPGFRRANGPFTAPAAGERLTVRIELEPLARSPALIVHVVDEQGAPITAAGIRLESRPDPAVKGEQEISIVGGDQLASNGRFVLHDVKPGEYQLRVHPGGRYLGGDGFFAEVARDVTIRAGAVETIECVALARGRLRVAARDSSGRFLPAQFSLCDEAGRPVEAWPIDILEDASGGLLSIRSHAGLAIGDLNRIEPALAPGRYVATFALAGFESRSVPLEIKPLQPTDLEVVLAPAH